MWMWLTKLHALITSFGLGLGQEIDVGITTEDEYAATPHNISSIVMTLVLVRDHTASRCVPLVMTGRFIRLLVHPALLALMSSMSYSGKATLFERTHIS